MGVPTVVNFELLQDLAGVPIINANTSTYQNIVNGWMHPTDLNAWLAFITNGPRLFVFDFFASNFFVLPAVFLVIAVLSLATRTLRLRVAEAAMFGMAFLVWAFGNLGPPYDGWQLRGDWIARVNQPAFGPMLVFIANRCAALTARGYLGYVATATVVLGIVINAAVVIGPWVQPDFTGTVYSSFYKHGLPTTLATSLAKYGRRPLGVCDPANAASTSVTLG
jgi:hypothetical protein